jgi:hypothetical protein
MMSMAKQPCYLPGWLGWKKGEESASVGQDRPAYHLEQVLRPVDNHWLALDNQSPDLDFLHWIR